MKISERLIWGHTAFYFHLIIFLLWIPYIKSVQGHIYLVISVNSSLNSPITESNNKSWDYFALLGSLVRKIT